MIRRIEMIDFRKDMSEADKKIAAFKIKKGLENLNGKVNGLIKVEVEALLLPSSDADMVIVAKFEDESAIEAYKNTPLRLNLSAVWNSAVSGIKTAEYVD